MKNKIDGISKIIATFFGIGYLPVMPGTFGSIAGVAIYYFLAKHEYVFYGLLFLLIMLGFGACGRAENAFKRKDPRSIVIDEVVGVMIAFILVPVTWINIIIVFVLFRLIDIFKPFPIRKIEKVPGSFGIMLDDIVAGFYANILFQAGFSIASYRLL